MSIENKEEENSEASIFKRNIIKCIVQDLIFRTENRIKVIKFKIGGKNGKDNFKE